MFYDNLFVVAVSTGLRPGEVCALTLKDVDFKDSLIRVNKTLVYQTFEGEEKKTPAACGSSPSRAGFAAKAAFDRPSPMQR